MSKNIRDDADRIKDAIHKLRTENRKLRKENGHLKKEIHRFDNAQFDRSVELEDEDIPEDLVEVPKETLRCPSCKSEDFKVVPAGMYKINICNACGQRKRLKAKD